MHEVVAHLLSKLASSLGAVSIICSSSSSYNNNFQRERERERRDLKSTIKRKKCTAMKDTIERVCEQEKVNTQGNQSQM